MSTTRRTRRTRCTRRTRHTRCTRRTWCTRCTRRTRRTRHVSLAQHVACGTCAEAWGQQTIPGGKHLQPCQQYSFLVESADSAPWSSTGRAFTETSSNSDGVMPLIVESLGERPCDTIPHVAMCTSIQWRMQVLIAISLPASTMVHELASACACYASVIQTQKHGLHA